MFYIIDEHALKESFLYFAHVGIAKSFDIIEC